MSYNKIDQDIREKLEEMKELPGNVNWSVDKGWEQYQRKYRTRQKTIVYWLSSAAAVFVLLLVFWITSSKDQTLHISAENQKQQISLKDGTKIWINKNSEVTLNLVKNIIMLEGEVYIELSGEKKYQIKSPHGKFIAKNSHFNLESGKEKKAAEITVSEGKVKFYWEEGAGIEKTIKKGEQARIVQDIAVIKTPVEDRNYLAWKTETLQFQNTPLFFVTDKLEELNNVQIEFDNKEIRYCRMSNKFKSTSAESVLKQIPQLLNCEVEQSGNKYVIKGPGC